MKTVLVTKKEYEKAKDRFSAIPADWTVLPVPAEEDALADSIKKHSARCVIVGVEQYVGPLYDALHEVSPGDENTPGTLIARFGVGHDGIDKILARKLNVAVTNTPGILSRSVAEHTFWLMGALLRNVVKGDGAMRGGHFPSMSGHELYDKTLLVVGAGEIGRRVARIARFGFGMHVLAAGRVSLDTLADRLTIPKKQFLDENGIERYSDDIDRLLPEADVVSLHLASTPQTRHFMSETRFGAIKTTAILVNTARGPVVDEKALFDALSSGQIAGAALDVFETEPYEPVNVHADLRTLENVVLTPHLGSSSVEANRRMAEATLKNVERFFDGKFDEMNLVS